jgi:hypothetical protein
MLNIAIQVFYYFVGECKHYGTPASEDIRKEISRLYTKTSARPVDRGKIFRVGALAFSLHWYMIQLYTSYTSKASKGTTLHLLHPLREFDVVKKPAWWEGDS